MRPSNIYYYSKESNILSIVFFKLAGRMDLLFFQIQRKSKTSFNNQLLDFRLEGGKKDRGLSIHGIIFITFFKICFAVTFCYKLPLENTTAQISFLSIIMQTNVVSSCFVTL